MISAEEAIKLVLENVIPLGEEKVSLLEAQGRILAETIVADRDFPPFNRVMMDGIAINSHAWNEGRREFYIAGVQTAGTPQMTLKQDQDCFEVMTGAMLPINTDLVIRYEDIETDGKVAHVNIEEVRPLQNIHLKGTDRKVGDVLMEKNKRLSPAEIAILATVGKKEVTVLKRPNIAIVSTGDELVDVGETPNPYQIRKSNSYALQAALLDKGFAAEAYHIHDEKEVIKKEMEKILSENELVILSGGVSKGKKDYVPEVLEELEVRKLFHGVKQRPGKPFWFGIREEARKTAVFALPGNPVSTFMCFYRYTMPWLDACRSLEEDHEYAFLAEEFHFAPPLTYFLQVKLVQREGKLLAIPVVGRGSGDLANLLEADAFLMLPDDKNTFENGDVYPVIRYRH